MAGEYLITAACYEHRPVFDTPEALSYLTNEALESFQAAGLLGIAWVFLPNHYHVLLDASDLSLVSETLRVVHSQVATAMNYRQAQRVIRSERHHWATVNYVHYNPVKQGTSRKRLTGPG